MNFPAKIAQYIQTEERSFETEEIQVFDNFDWNFKQHVMMTLAFKHGKFIDGTNEYKTKNPFRNITIINLRLRYRAEDLDVTDVVIYVDDPNKQVLSFLVKKYHDNVFTQKHNLDLFIDAAKEASIDFGGTLIEKGVDGLPKVVPLQSIAFCDQTDILGGPIGFKFNYSPDQLRAKAKQGWGDPANGATISLEDLIVLSRQEKDPISQHDTQTNKTTGNIIEVYIVRGQMPKHYLDDSDDDELINQVQIVAFYQNGKEREAQILYRNKEKEGYYKFFTSDPIFNRALGEGGAEEIFDDQIWTNFSEVHKTKLLEAASKIVFQTSDENFTNRNKIKELDNFEVAVTRDGTRLEQIQNGTPNIQLFTQSLIEWQEHAREVGAATDPLLGKQPPAGTPFRLQERVVFEGKGLHEYRRGKFAKFIEEIYKDWIIPHIGRELMKGAQFIADLDSDELQWVQDRLASNQAAKAQINDMLDGKIPRAFEELKREELAKLVDRRGKYFFEILKDELRDLPLKVKVNVAAKQKDLSLLTDKLVNVLQQYLSTPQLRQDPVASKLLNKILEASGLSPLDINELQLNQLPPQPASQSKPIEEITKVPAGVR